MASAVFNAVFALCSPGPFVGARNCLKKLDNLLNCKFFIFSDSLALNLCETSLGMQKNADNSLLNADIFVA